MGDDATNQNYCNVLYELCIFACYFLIIKIVTKRKQQYILQRYSKNRPHNYGSN